ncbi:glycosyltransferase [Akkermansiaceae bacterium]|nr:glycosyltransferase [Akkermansiaceae bacterium]MDB4311025.1 glycosyltransferase [bacterium]MDB4268225.1 glycosyltransferase [Akkermansiaceae bacterium]MDB4321977.1 glycosyltransferase [Akkermansiaceae bacterium]MDB4329168.1 glycosyltransferase [Akkermansiaceae bacterium]
MTPDFTIVTASYNYGHFIRECLESVASQKGVTLEHLIHDGGSTDDTADVVADFPHAQFIQKPDLGMSDAINKGFSRARGKWVIWLNSDDRLKPGALKAVLEFSKGKDETDVIFGGWDFIDKDGEYIRSMTIFPFQKSMLCYLGCYIGSTSTFYRNSTTVDQGIHLDVNFKYVMDGEYYNRLASLGKKFTYMHALLADFRIHGMNLSLRNKQCINASERLILEKQYAESSAIKREYGWCRVTNPPLVWFVDGVLFGYYGLKKFLLKRCFRILVPLRKISQDVDEV